MLSDLLERVDELELAPRGDDIAAAIAARDQLSAKITAAVGDFDHAGDWALDGATSATAWLRSNAGMSGGDAAATVKNGRRVRQLPAVHAAWTSGRLSAGQVSAIVHNVDDATIALLQRDEDELVPFLEPLDVHDTVVVMRDWKARADALADRPEPTTPERTAHLSKLMDGRGRLDADLDPEGFAIAQAALRRAMTRDGDADEPRGHARRQGDALVDVLRFFLDNHHGDVSKNRNRPHVNVVIRDEDLRTGDGATFADGTPADPATIRRMMCDANVNRVVIKGRSVILDLGTSVRTFTDAQFAALALRDRHCRWTGCDRPPWWAEAHHVAHAPGWTTKIEPDGTFHVTASDGRTRATHPAGILTFDA